MLQKKANNLLQIILEIRLHPNGRSFSIGRDSVPPKLDFLLGSIIREFKQELPKPFYLEYEDIDGDPIMLTTEEDYMAMLRLKEQDEHLEKIKIFVKLARIPDDEEKIIPLSEELLGLLNNPSRDARPVSRNAGIKQDQPEDDEPEEDLVIKMQTKDNTNQIAERKAEISIIQRTATERKVQAITLRQIKDYMNGITFNISKEIAKNLPSAKLPRSRIENMLFLSGILSGNPSIPGIPKRIKVSNFGEGVSSSNEKLSKGHNTSDYNLQNTEPQRIELLSEIDSVKIAATKNDYTTPFDGILKRQVCVIPLEPKETDTCIYTTVILRNTGKTSWPPGAFITSVGEITGDKIAVPQVIAGQNLTTVLINRNPGKAGEYIATWRLGFRIDTGEVCHFGDAIKVFITVKKIAHGNNAAYGKIILISYVNNYLLKGSLQRW